MRKYYEAHMFYVEGENKPRVAVFKVYLKDDLVVPYKYYVQAILDLSPGSGEFETLNRFNIKLFRDAGTIPQSKFQELIERFFNEHDPEDDWE